MFKMIVAMSRNRGIGYGNSLPWKLQNDMKYFKRMTIGNGNNCVIMGKNTWYSLRSSINEPLPKRDKIIMSSKNIGIFTPHSELANNLQATIDICAKNSYNERWVIGGEQIYNTFLDNDLVDEIYITQINKDYTCDTFFPPIPNNFILISTTESVKEKDVSFRYERYQKDKICSMEEEEKILSYMS